MTDEQPKAGRPGDSRPNGDLQGEANVFAEGQETNTDVDTGSPRTDDLIAQDVNVQLVQDAVIDPASLTVSVENGEVALDGYVAQLADKARAEELVLDVDGVTALHNNLRIAPERH